MRLWNRWGARALVMALVVAASSAATGSVAHAATPVPTVTAFSQSTTTVNVNNTTTQTLTVKFTTANFTYAPFLSYVPSAASSGYSETGPGVLPIDVDVPETTSVAITQQSGTSPNGVWTGTLTSKYYLPVGWDDTYTPEIGYDGADGWVSLSTSALEAAGAAPINTVVAKAPGTPFVWAAIEGIQPIAVLPLMTAPSGDFRYTSSGGPAAVLTVDSLSGACAGALTPGSNDYLRSDSGLLDLVDAPSGSCTVQFHLWNSAGRSGETQATGTF